MQLVAAFAENSWSNRAIWFNDHSDDHSRKNVFSESPEIRVCANDKWIECIKLLLSWDSVQLIRSKCEEQYSAVENRNKCYLQSTFSNPRWVSHQTSDFNSGGKLAFFIRTMKSFGLRESFSTEWNYHNPVTVIVEFALQTFLLIRYAFILDFLLNNATILIGNWMHTMESASESFSFVSNCNLESHSSHWINSKTLPAFTRRSEKKNQINPTSLDFSSSRVFDFPSRFDDF